MDGLERVGSGYIFRQSVAGHQIEARIKGVKETATSVKAMIALSVDGRGIHRSIPSLTSVSGLDGYWKKLARRMPTADWGIDWEAVVELMAGQIIDAHSTGEDEVVLGEVDLSAEAKWAVAPMLLAEQPNIIYGPGGSGKSMIALWVAVLMDTGHVDTTHGLSVVPGRVLYLDWETDEQEIAGRAESLQQGLGITGDRSNIVYRRCTLPLANDADHVKDLVEKHKIDFVIADSLGLACGGALDEAEGVLSYFSALRWIGGTSLTLSHTNKEGKLFGSVYTTNSGRSIWEIQKSSTEGDNHMDVGLFHRKVNNTAHQQPLAFRLSFEDEMVTFESKDPMDTEVVSDTLSASELVYQIVSREGPVPRSEIADRVAAYMDRPVEKVAGSVATAISRHLKAARIVELDGELAIQALFKSLEDGEWTL